MSDEKLRELERRWRASGTLEDEAAYLRERARVGDLSLERLELAAYCGQHVAVRLVTNLGPQKVKPWCRGLSNWGVQPALRALLALAAWVNPVFEEDPTNGSRFREVVDAVETWLVCPCPLHWEAVVQFEATNACRGGVFSYGNGTHEGLAVARRVLDACLLRPHERTPEHARETYVRTATGRCVAKALGEAALAHSYARVGDYRLLDSALVEGRGVICAELTPWALGEGDPVRERVEARKTAND